MDKPTYTDGYRGGSNLRGVKYDPRINLLVHVLHGCPGGGLLPELFSGIFGDKS